VYEQPSLHMELARLKHKDFAVEADRARLAAQAPRDGGEGIAVIKSAIAGLRSALSRRRPVVAHETRLQPVV
jgi:hypothetical protein